MSKKLSGTRVMIVVASLFASAAPSAWAQTSAAIDLSAQPLVDTLRALGKSTDTNILIDPKLVRNIRAPAIKGNLTAAQALARLLAGTSLRYRFIDERTIVLESGTAAGLTTSSSAEPQPALMQLARADKRDDTAGDAKSSTDPSETQDNGTEIRVTGSRIRRDLAETGVSPVIVFTRQDIDRSGAMVMGDFIGRITQGNFDPTSLENQGIPFSGRATVNLRGLGNNTTLVLLNGRRLPKSGQGTSNDDYNLNGIPLASVERIEVLTNNASAIYGSDAIGGVVNIITRDRYNGIDVSAQYGNTFDSDTSEKSLNLTAGHAGTVFTHLYSFTLNAGTNDRNPLAAKDRPYTARSNYADSGGRQPQEVDLFGIVGAAGGVSTVDPFDPTPLPGLTSNFIAIPVGQDGRNLTIADFANPGPLVGSLADLPDYRLLLTPSTDQTASLSASLDLTPRAQLFVEGSYFEYRSEYDGPPPSASVRVPASNPFNPFGVDVNVSKVFYELGPSHGIMHNLNSRAVTGVRGAMFKDWRYEVSGDYSRYVGASDNPIPIGINFDPDYIFTPDGDLIIVDTPGSAAINSTDPVHALNVFGDGRTTQPNDIALTRSLLGVDEYSEVSENWTGSFQTDGTLMQLPGGALKMAFGGEYRREKVNIHIQSSTVRYGYSLDGIHSRSLKAAFLEFSVPLIGERQHVPGARSLELSLAGRMDSESLFGKEITPRAGLLWRPVESIALRTTYSRGYKVPNLKQLYGAQLEYQTIYSVPPLDPVTGELIDGFFYVRQGGNPDLTPERSASWSAGVIYQPRWAPQFSFSADYSDIDYRNKVEDFVDVQNVLDFFPERVERDPVDNRVTLVDTRTINISNARVRALDLRLVHRLSTATHGAFDSQLGYTYNMDNRQQSSPTSPVFENIDTAYYPRVRATASTFWTYGGFELGSTVSYESSTANILFMGATAPIRIHHSVVTDLQSSFDFGAQGGTRSLWTEGLKLTAGINNIFDVVPPPNDGDGGYTRIDPRQRRYYLSLKRSF